MALFGQVSNFLYLFKTFLCLYHKLIVKVFSTIRLVTYADDCVVHWIWLKRWKHTEHQGSQCERHLRPMHLPCQFHHLRFPRSIQPDPWQITSCSALSEWEADHQHRHQDPHKILIGTDSYHIHRSCLVQQFLFFPPDLPRSAEPQGMVPISFYQRSSNHLLKDLDGTPHQIPRHSI